jgi:hypothetical protein
MASKLFLVDLDLNLNKAKNFRLEDFSTDPSTSLESGRLVYFTGIGTSQNHFKAYNGTAWKTLAYTDDVPDIEISLEAATGFTVSGSPADASGTLTFEWDEVAPGHVLAGLLDTNTSPAPGNSIPTFRALGEQDIPVEIARVEDVNTSLEDYILLTEKGEPLGVAELNASGTVPAEQLDLINYATLDGQQTFTDWKVFGAGLYTESFIGLWSSNTTSTPSMYGGGFIYVDGTTENLVISASEGMTSELGGNVVVSGTGQYIGSVDPDNQIATIGDINSEGVNLLTGTTNQIVVSGDGTGDVTLSLDADIILGGTAKAKIHFKNASDVQAATLQAEGSGDFSVVGDANVIISATGGEYLGSVTTNNQIATIGDLSSGYQPLDQDLTDIAALTTEGFLYRTSEGVWEMDAYEYLTRTEWLSSAASEIDSTDVSNWDTAYGWGNHASVGYLTTAVQDISNTDGNITFSSSTGSVTADFASSIATDTVRAYYFTARSSSASLFDDSPSDITIGTGAGTANIGIGSATSTVTINNDLVVTGDLTVNGDVTTLNTATMNVEDNIFVLNSNVTGTPSLNAGLEVERGDYTNASIFWDESFNIWSVSSPKDTTAAAVEHALVRKYATQFGTSATSYTVTHDLGTRDVTASVYEVSSPYAQVEAAIEYTTKDTITVYFNTAPSADQYRVVVTG